MNLSYSLKGCILATLLLSPLNTIHADGVFTSATNLISSPTKIVKYTAAAALFLSIFKFFATEPNNNPVRYDLERLKSGNTDENGNFDWNNLKYFILDGIIGHPGKRPSLRVDSSGKIDASQGAYPKGLYGNGYEYLSPIAKALTFPIAFKAFLLGIYEGHKNWEKCTENFIKFIF